MKKFNVLVIQSIVIGLLFSVVITAMVLEVFVVESVFSFNAFLVLLLLGCFVWSIFKCHEEIDEMYK